MAMTEEVAAAYQALKDSRPTGVRGCQWEVNADIGTVDDTLNAAIVSLRDLSIGARLIGRRDTAHALRRIITALRGARDEFYAICEVR